MHDLVVGHWFLMPWESGLVRHGWCVLESWVVVDASDEMGKKKTMVRPSRSGSAGSWHEKETTDIRPAG